ncbi:polysaccharide pyruvyl transferase family protein [Methylocella sp.]|uniref:polysaccharide pyruvyl transferase family protein n=1 Tax=Methylocella sp. TaxID=1978226 RepID=UPI003783BA43
MLFDDLNTIPLVWVASTQTHPDCNLGDALSAVLVAVLSGKPVRRAAFDRPEDRLAAVGTIGQNFREGEIHFWGTGLDAARHPVHGAKEPFGLAPDTKIVAHAVRGRFTGRALEAAGVADPGVYGDPVLLLPKIVPPEAEKTRELGIILHISELEQATATGGVKEIFKRYRIPPELEDEAILVNTYTAANFPAMKAKIREIQSCRRILSTSLHGIVLAEIYGIPCAWFATYPGGLMRLPVEDPAAKIDHRFRDFYSGVGASHVLAYAQDRGQPTDFAAAMTAIDREWRPLAYDGRALYDAFPLAKAVSFDDPLWPAPEGLMNSIPF